MAPFRPRIAIAGGGPSGLALGLLLHRRGIPATIYDVRGRMGAEELAKPSGMLDLHEESGLAVMRECGLWDKFQAAVGDCSEAMRVLDQHGTLLHADEGELAYRPEIPRNALTNLLVEHVPAQSIRWHHKIREAWSGRNEATGATEITLDLGAHGRATYDFVVGADGAWSRVRRLLTDVAPFYSGNQFLTATLRHASTRHPRLAELNGTGVMTALGGGNGILGQRGTQDSIRVYAAVRTADEDWATTAGLAGKTAAEAKAVLLQTEDGPFHSWAASLQELLATACDDETRDNPGCAADIKPLYMLPVGHTWDHRPGVTLVGDAAHLMTPWAGEGVNLALWDALDLSRALAAVSVEAAAPDAAAWQAALEPHVRAYEQTMWARAREKAAETAANMDLFLSEHGAQAVADMFKRAGYA